MELLSLTKPTVDYYYSCSSFFFSRRRKMRRYRKTDRKQNPEARKNCLKKVLLAMIVRTVQNEYPEKTDDKLRKGKEKRGKESDRINVTRVFF
jgi:hypothetical protein